MSPNVLQRSRQYTLVILCDLEVRHDLVLAALSAAVRIECHPFFSSPIEIQQHGFVIRNLEDVNPNEQSRHRETL